MQVPFANFLTEAKYVDMLVEAGYPEGAIEVVDISGDEFGGLAKFLNEMGKQVGTFGIGGWGGQAGVWAAHETAGGSGVMEMIRRV
jgi:hypothetical protein